MRKIKIAQIGINQFSHGRHIIETMKSLSDVFDIVGYCLPENEKERFPEIIGCFDGYPELTLDEIMNDPEIEAVTVETEEKYLTKYAIMAAEAGKHIHMEKPGGTSLPEFEKLIDTVKKSGKVFHTGYMYRYNPMIKNLINSVKNGELGEIISVEAQMNCIEPKELREWLTGYKGGMTFFLGCHLIDLILQLQGSPKRVIPMNRSTHNDGILSVDFGFVLFEYENGISFAKINGSETGGFARRQLVVTGTKKTVEIKPLEMFADGGQYTEQTVYENSGWGDCGEKSRTEPYNRYKDMMKSFAEYICGEKVNPFSYEQEYELYRVITECLD